MTWMPDRSAAPRSRRRSSRSSQSPAHRSGWADDLGYDEAEHPQGAGPQQLGIPRIIGRRARWVGARLRRET
ncbi:hypothetical protein [Kitasatospora sp. NPDC057223]|uniref:hypothetical protein n=1 Tax=Kitasatospora sp. NPDC057223 TaxID=3346055 RepID=UPI0036376956